MSILEVVVHVFRYAREEDDAEAFRAKRVLVAKPGVVAAACGVPCQETGKHDRTNALFAEVARVMCAIADAHGVVLNVITQSALKIFEPGILWPVQRYAMSAKSSEFEAQLGRYVRRVERLEVNASTLSVLYALILAKTKTDGRTMII